MDTATDTATDTVATDATAQNTRKKFSLYCMANYNKSAISQDTADPAGLFRSVILNCQMTKIVCFSPPKSVPYQEFITKYIKTDDIVAQQMIEGTMINIAYVHSDATWIISTKKTIGANTMFYQPTHVENGQSLKTFRDMFNDALAECGIRMDQFDKTLTYSFVMQHPHNQIVNYVDSPALYLIAVYSYHSSDDGVTTTVTPMDIYDASIITQFIDTGLRFPGLINYGDTGGDPDLMTNTLKTIMCNNTSMSYRVPGIMLYNRKTRERTKIRNPMYENLKRLRGNCRTLMEQFLTLRKTPDGVSQFLIYFPSATNEFAEFTTQLKFYAMTLYEAYVCCFIKKSSRLSSYSIQYAPNLKMLHELYLSDLRAKNKKITKSRVNNFVGNLAIPAQMFCLNYNNIANRRIAQIANA